MSGTYTYPANSTGGTVDMGVNNTYRYVNASNVYNKGKADGVASTSGTATAAQILSGYTAWVNGSKITGSMPNRDASTQVANNKAWHYNNRIYFGIDYGYYPAASFGSMNNVSEKYITYDALARDIGIDANKMLSGYSVLGVNGNIPSRSNGEAVYATGVDSHGPYAYVPYGSYPSSSYRSGYSYVYLTEAQVRNYDSDIIAGNIKKGVNILGITGTYEGGAVLTGDIKAEDETINLNAPFVGHSDWGQQFSGSGTTWVYFPKDTYWLIRLSCGCSNGHRNGSSESDPWATDSHVYSEYKLTVHDGSDRVIAHESGAYDHNGSYFVFMKAGSSAEIYMRGDGGNHNGAAASATRIYSN